MSLYLKFINLSLKQKAGIILLLVSVFFISLFFIFVKDSDFYKSSLINSIQKSTGYQINFNRTDFLVFPFPGIRFENIILKDRTSAVIGSMGALDLRIHWKSIINRNPSLRSIKISNGKIDLTGQNYQKIFSKDPGLKNGNSIIDLKLIQASNFTFIFQLPDSKRTHKLYTYETKIDVSFFTSSGVVSYLGKLNGQKIRVFGDYAFNESFLNYKDLRLNLKTELEEFSLDVLKSPLSDFKNIDFGRAGVSGAISIIKKDDDITLFEMDTKFSNLGFKGGQPFADLFCKYSFYYTISEKKIVINSSTLEWPGKVKLSFTGSVNFHEQLSYNFNIVSAYSDFDSLLLLSQLLATKDSTDPYYANSVTNIRLVLNNFYAFGHFFSKGWMDLYYKNPLLEIRNSSFNLYEGLFAVQGKILLYAVNRYDCKAEMKGVNVEKILKVYTNEQLFSGKMDASFAYKSIGNDNDTFMKQLVSDGSFNIKNGKMLGYANALKPVASLGKFINVLGPRGESTEFANLTSPFRVRNYKVYLDNLQMTGVGLDLQGKGFIGLDNQIDMRVKVALGGAVGKVLYIPVIYKGVIPENYAYVDPVWLGSVYFGMTFLAGPAGAAVGGMAGSAVSDYVHSAWDGFKSLFRKKESAPE